MIMVPSAGDQVQHLVQKCHYNTLAAKITVVTGFATVSCHKIAFIRT